MKLTKEKDTQSRYQYSHIKSFDIKHSSKYPIINLQQIDETILPRVNIIEIK